MTATINLHADETAPSAQFLTLDNGTSFIELHIGGVSLFLYGCDDEAVASARAIVVALSNVVTALENRLAEHAAALERKTA